VRKNTSPSNRIAVVVGKSVDKRAVRRNFWKRQAKMQLLRLPSSGMDIIMTVYPRAGSLTKAQFIGEIKKILKK
jgi:ribonuclease P protein component